MNLNFKLLAILIIILGFLVLGKYSLYAHNRIEELNNDVNEYQKAFTESNKARVHYEAISESQEKYYTSVLNNLNKSKLNGVYKCSTGRQETNTRELTCYRQDELLGRLQQSLDIVRRCQREVNKCNELRELIKGELK